MEVKEFYIKHGVTFRKMESGQLLCDCPSCGKEKHFYIEPTVGTFKCFVCDYKGNCHTYMKDHSQLPPEKYKAEIKEIPHYARSNRDRIQAVVKSEDPKYQYPNLSRIRALTDEERQIYAETKDVTPDTLKRFRVQLLGSDIVIPAWNPDSPKNLNLPTAWVRDSFNGSPIRFPDGSVRKYPVVKNSHHGLIGLTQLVEYIDGYFMPKHVEKVFLVEGVRDVLRMSDLGYVAVSTSGGCGWWDDSLNPYFDGRKVYICYDADVAGQSGQAKIIDKLKKVTDQVYAMKLPYIVEESSGKDLSDYLDEGKSIEKLIEDCEIVESLTYALDDIVPNEHNTVITTLAQDLAHHYLDYAVNDFHYWNDDYYELKKDNKYYQVTIERARRDFRRHIMKLWLKKRRDDDGNQAFLRIGVTEMLVRNVMAVFRSLDGVCLDVHEKDQYNFWLRGDPSKLTDPKHIIAMSDCLIDVSGADVVIIPHTPDFFTTNYKPYTYNENASCPSFVKWVKDIFTVTDELGDTCDELEVRLLQEYFGLLLTSDQSYQKAMILQGQRRSGKSTLQHIVEITVGSHNVCATDLNALGSPFGLYNMVNKAVAIIGDMASSIKGSAMHLAVERIKSITGDDKLYVEGKNKNALSIRLPTRFLIGTNHVNNMPDVSGTLATRFYFLKFRHTYLGREDVRLYDTLREEVQGIFNWALAGYVRLRQRGYFIEPEVSKELRNDFQNVGSPMGEFARECLEPNAPIDAKVRFKDLYEVFNIWCSENGRNSMSSAKLKADLKAVVPQIQFKRTTYEGSSGRSVALGITLQDDWLNPRQRKYEHGNSNYIS